MAWSERVGMVSDRSAEALRQAAREHPRRTKAAVQRAASLRAAVNETFGALVEGRSPRAGSEQLRPFVTAALQKAELTVDHSDRTLAWDFAELESLLWPRGRGCIPAAHQPGASAAEAVRRLSMVVSRPFQERQPPLVLDGGLRHP